MTSEYWSWLRSAGLATAAGLTFVPGALAADMPGCKDPSGLKRFQGSSLVLCENRDFGEYTLPAGKLLSWDYNTKTPNFESQIADQGRIFEHMGPGEQLFGYSSERSRYLSAVKDEGGRQTYVSLYVIEYLGGVHSKLKGEIGQVMVRLDTITVGGLADRMTLVSASEMQQSIDETGRVTLYGIQFDFNKADIKPQSRPALDEIAKYLRANPGRRLHVVGHTDGLGGFDFNIKLSESRAKAVVAELVRAYGIDGTRLRGNGVGVLAPIATNATDDGRAKNRRVELVAM